MSRNMIKILSIIISCLMLISFVGCDASEDKKSIASKPAVSTSDKNSNKDKEKEQTENEYTEKEQNTETSTKQELKTVSLFDAEGNAKFRLMRGAESDKKTIEVVNNLRNTIKSRRINVDYKIDKVAESKDLIEVLVGDTNRAASSAAKKELQQNRKNYAFDFIIKFTDNKLCIVAGSEFVIEDAVNQFVKDFLASKTTAIPENYTVIYENNKKLVETTVSGTPIQNYVIVRPRYNLSYIVGKEIDELQNGIFENIGHMVDVVTDNKAEVLYEIIIGNAKRNGVSYVNSANSYQIRVDGKKVYINGGNEISTAAAVQKFTAAVIAGGKIVSSSGTADATADNYRLVWSEEFSGDSLNMDNWHFTTRSMASQMAGYNTVYTDDSEHVFVKDGKLHLVSDFDGKQYYSSEIDTKASMWYQYGYIEISARVPGQKGMVPAFWSRGAGREIWPEFDFFECLGDPSSIKGTLIGWPGGEINTHGWTTFTVVTEKFPKSASYYNVPEGENLYDEFHTIGCYWDVYSVVWTCDGVEFARCDELTASEKYSATFHTPIHLLLSMQTAVGNDGFPPPDNTTDWTKGDFTIDYVRLYQTDGQTLSLRK